MSETILIIENDERVAEFIERGLTHEGYGILVAAAGETGLEMARQNKIDLILLAQEVSDASDVCKRLKSLTHAPILVFLQEDSRNQQFSDINVVDSYLRKPFTFEELLVNIRVMIRRSSVNIPEVISYGDITVNTHTHLVERDGCILDLTNKEYYLMEMFIRHPRQIISRDVLFDRIWGYSFDGDSSIIEICMQSLQKKIEVNNLPKVLHTVYGIGYILDFRVDKFPIEN